MHRLTFHRCSAFLILLFSATWVSAFYWVGVSKVDITGPAVGSGMMCYAESSQISAGINDRQWARTFVVRQSESENSLVIVVIDAGAVFASIYQAVLNRLEQQFGTLYNRHNIIITATHTHSAVAGQSHHFLYNMPYGIFDDRAFEKMVSGIVQAITLAHEDLAPSEVWMKTGLLDNASRNRSLPAYENNVDAGQRDSIDQSVQQLRFIRNGRPLGAITWFATHAVSFPSSNLLLSSDNKGYASWAFERYAKYNWGVGSFVAAFPQTNAGDMTPNLNLDGTGPGNTPDENAREIGHRQFMKALEIYLGKGREVFGEITSVQNWVDFSNYEVQANFTGLKEPVKTCHPSMGYGFAAGTEDGRPPFLIRLALGAYEGRNSERWLVKIATDFLTSPSEDDLKCQKPKPVILSLGRDKKYHYLNDWLPPGNMHREVINQPWVPEVLPLMLARIGNFQIAALPVEPTVMAGRRLRNRLSQLSGIPPRQTVIAGYSNDYASYLTTAEEFSKQHYEGASTLYGPWEHSAMMQIFSSLSRQLSGEELASTDEAEPLDLSYLYDDVRVEDILEKEDQPYGRIISDVPVNINSGQSIKLRYIASHPRSGMDLDSFFYVQKKNDWTGCWETVATDDDWTTQFNWKSGIASVEWTPDRYDDEGVYRMVLQGEYYTVSQVGVKKRYQSTSDEFHYSARCYNQNPHLHLSHSVYMGPVSERNRSCMKY
ncbi:MAG: neutral/alkaline non-lysosomal ceramidase N-terminal domain-containing protein [Endozoicomonas sp.]|uniref:neutral/alkaline non-lysosomal ceramidase N-terminal domain-containing protein n=1 Tax=Endozoicomonas sp. TaxID=1892382 RepID=UPI003D9BC92B